MATASPPPRREAAPVMDFRAPRFPRFPHDKPTTNHDLGKMQKSKNFNGKYRFQSCSPLGLQEAPGGVQDASKRLQERPKTSQDASKTPQDRPKTAPRRLKTPQAASKRLQDAPRQPEVVPKTPPRPPKSRPKRPPKTHLRGRSRTDPRDGFKITR